jgi:DNA repair exonuclease SbcCD ATPase subunit
MKKVRIESIDIKNYKGIDVYQCSFNTLNEFRGDNGTFKTSLVECIGWVLDDKDLYGRSISPRTLDSRGLNVKGKNTSVTVVFNVDGVRIEVNKQHLESLTKHKLEEQRKIKSFTKKYEINGDSYSEAGFKKEISRYFEPSLFRLLSNPKAFNLLGKDEQRNVLEQLSPVTNELIKKKIGAIPEYVSKCIDQEKDLLQEQKTLKKNLKVRNDDLLQKTGGVKENTVQLEEMPFEQDVAALKERIEEIEKDIENKKSQCAESANAKKNAEINSNITLLQTELVELNGELLQNAQKEYNELFNKKNDLLSAHQEAKDDHQNLIDIIGENEKVIQYNQQKLNQMREECRVFFDTSNRKINNDPLVCPVSMKPCGCDETLKYFTTNREKVHQDSITEALKSLKDKQRDGANLKHENDELVKETENIRKLFGESEKKLSLAEKAYNDMPAAEMQRNFSENKRVVEIKDKIEKLKSQISIHPESIDDYAEEHNQISELKKSVEQEERREFIKNRIKTLNDERQLLFDKCNVIEANLAAIDKYNETKYLLIENAVNSKFGGGVHFKLFREQQNGTVVNDCICMVAGVPYAQYLNRGGKMKAGVEIIKTLQKHYSIEFPLICDDRESTTEIPVWEGQQVHMFKDRFFDGLTKTAPSICKNCETVESFPLENVDEKTDYYESDYCKECSVNERINKSKTI